MDHPERTAWLIRRATKEDKEPLQELQRRLNRPSRSDSVITEYFVAVSGQALVGCAAVRKQGEIGYLYGLVVDKSWRRRGIGHSLTQARLDWLVKQDVALAFVMAMFWNVRFFRKHGFEVSGPQGKRQLRGLHNDFNDTWAIRSTLLRLSLH